MTVKILKLGLKPYDEVWELQRQTQKSLMSGETEEEILILCQHTPVITLGKSTKKENLLADSAKLDELGISVFEIERGGDITFHGPGQIVGYPIIDLKRRRCDVHWYMRSLENLLIDALNHYDINAFSLEGKTGVWVNKSQPRKIASMGVRISRWVTMHGFALNVRDCSAGFSLINPCGFSNAVMTCMERESGRALALEEVENNIVDAFQKHLS